MKRENDTKERRRLPPGTRHDIWTQYVDKFNHCFLDATEAAGIDADTALPPQQEPLVKFYFGPELVGKVSLCALKAVSEGARHTFHDDVIVTNYHLRHPVDPASIAEVLAAIEQCDGADNLQIYPKDDFAANVKLYDAALSAGLTSDLLSLVELSFETTLKKRLVMLAEMELVFNHFSAEDDLLLMVAENVAHFRRRDLIPNIVEYELFTHAHGTLGEMVTGFDNMAEKGRAQLFESSLS